MDFASLMSREYGSTSVKNSAKSASNGDTTKHSPSSESKYLKHGESERQREEAYRQEQAALQREKEAKLKRKRQIEEDEAVRKQERDDKRRRLAEESRRRREEEERKKEKARRKRLGLPDLPEPEAAENKQQNGDSNIHDKTTAPTTTTTADPSSPLQTDTPIPTSLTLLPESSLKVPATPPSDDSTHPYLYRQLVSYFTLLLRAWRDALASRPASVANTSTGKQALAAYTTSLTNLRPLFNHFERATLDRYLLAAVLEIVSAAQERRYVDANDAYLRLSIGKAAWPIGVTMVGIHERSAREKLSEHGAGRQDVTAHIMSDEGTRKWLQSLKRCLSFAQTRWPPEDVGQMMG